MAKCKGLVTTAGFESVSEAMFLRKPVLMIPVKGHFEQFCNSRDAFKIGAGIFSEKFEINKLTDSFFYDYEKMKGYITEEAQMLAAETRTSSPVRIPRDNETLMHIEAAGLFPCGEGAGYAGGIVSAAIDGERSADAVAKFIA